MGITLTSADSIQSVTQWCTFYNLRQEKSCLSIPARKKIHSLTGSQTHSSCLVGTLQASSDWISWSAVLSEIFLVLTTCKLQGLNNGPDTIWSDFPKHQEKSVFSHQVVFTTHNPKLRISPHLFLFILINCKWVQLRSVVSQLTIGFYVHFRLSNLLLSSSGHCLIYGQGKCLLLIYFYHKSKAWVWVHIWHTATMLVLYISHFWELSRFNRQWRIHAAVLIAWGGHWGLFCKEKLSKVIGGAKASGIGKREGHACCWLRVGFTSTESSTVLFGIIPPEW